MPTGFNDQAAWLNKSGNLSLGQAGVDDSSGDATYPYAKGDVFIPVPASALRIAANVSANWIAATGEARAALGTTGVGVAGAVTLPAVGTTAPNYFVQVPLPAYLRTVSGQLNTRSAANPHGFLVRGLRFGYTVTGAALTTAPTVSFFTEQYTNAQARATGQAIVAGTVTYENPPLDKTSGTVVTALPTTGSNPLMVKANIGTPTWITSLDQQIYAEISFPMAATGAGVLHGVAWVGAAALY